MSGFPGNVYCVRTERYGTGVRGRWVLPDGSWLHSLEDRPIPAGKYLLTPDDTGRHRNWVIELAKGSRCAVPAVLDCFGHVDQAARTAVEIHAGNTLEDTRGCVLLGMTRTVDGIWQSEPAIEHAREVLRRDDRKPPTWGLVIVEAFSS